MDLHSTMVLLKQSKYAQIIFERQNLHSTMVLLKPFAKKSPNSPSSSHHFCRPHFYIQFSEH